MAKKRMHVFILMCLLLPGLFCKNKDPVSSDDPDDDPEVAIVTDIDGNVYNTVKIGNQIWTKEDVRTKRLNDGTKIQLVENDAEWVGLTTPALCYYKNSSNPDTIVKYGALYNWYALEKLAPAGWHVPSIAEWNAMLNYLEKNGFNWDKSTTGLKLAKAVSASSDWKSSQLPGAIGNDLSLNNKSGFTALPSGCRFHNGVFAYRGVENHWWSSTKTSYADHAYSIYLMKDTADVKIHAHYRDEGFSVRLVKDK